MSFIGKIYRRNIYGVIGTLAFHIVLISLFLLAEVEMKGKVKEDELLIEFPDVIPEPEKPEEILEEELEQENSQEVSRERNDLTNRASNRLAKENTTKSTDDFFNEEYLKEIEDAKSLVADVSKQLSKKIVDIKDIKMPVQSTTGMNPDSIKNVIYAGESNIVYYLENRHHIDLAIPVYLTQGGGKVIVDIVVNQSGKVIEAKSRTNGKASDSPIFLYAEAAASQTVFNSDSSAPPAQRGTIHYTFVAQ